MYTIVSLCIYWSNIIFFQRTFNLKEIFQNNVEEKTNESLIWTNILETVRPNYGNLLCSVRLSDSDIEDLDSEFEEYANELLQKFGVQISTGYPELICGATLS